MNEPPLNNQENGTDEAEVSSGLPAIVPELESILELLPQEKRPQALLLMTRVVSRSYRGPVPQAEDMAKYKAVDSSFPERFVRMAEQEQQHRHSLEKGDQANDFKLRKSGQNMAFVALVLMLAVIVLLVFLEHTTVAAILAGTTLVSVVGIFALGRYFEYKSEQTDLDA